MRRGNGANEEAQRCGIGKIEGNKTTGKLIYSKSIYRNFVYPKNVVSFLALLSKYVCVPVVLFPSALPICEGRAKKPTMTNSFRCRKPGNLDTVILLPVSMVHRAKDTKKKPAEAYILHSSEDNRYVAAMRRTTSLNYVEIMEDIFQKIKAQEITTIRQARQAVLDQSST